MAYKLNHFDSLHKLTKLQPEYDFFSPLTVLSSRKVNLENALKTPAVRGSYSALYCAPVSERRTTPHTRCLKLFGWSENHHYYSKAISESLGYIERQATFILTRQSANTTCLSLYLKNQIWHHSQTSFMSGCCKPRAGPENQQSTETEHNLKSWVKVNILSTPFFDDGETSSKTLF